MYAMWKFTHGRHAWQEKKEKKDKKEKKSKKDKADKGEDLEVPTPNPKPWTLNPEP